MNDEMDDFATPGISDAFGLAPSPFNYPEPGKRPLSSTSPLIMDHFNSNDTWLAIGGSGGSRIFPSVTQVIMNLDWGYDVDNSVQQSRYVFFFFFGFGRFVFLALTVSFFLCGTAEFTISCLLRG